MEKLDLAPPGSITAAPQIFPRLRIVLKSVKNRETIISESCLGERDDLWIELLPDNRHGDRHKPL